MTVTPTKIYASGPAAAPVALMLPAMVGLAGLFRFKWTYLVAGVILLGIGLGTYLTAHPAVPVEIDGTISGYNEFTQNGAYDHNELKLTGDSTTYTLDKTAFHPALPDSVYMDGKVSLWVERGSTTVIAITLYDDNDQNPKKYTTDHYDNPASELSDAESFGVVLSAIGAVLVGFFALLFVLQRRRRPAAMQTAGVAGPLTIPGASAPQQAHSPSIGLSPDGRWYWDGALWRTVSENGLYWWDGTRWQNVGGVPSPAGATPPIH